jgi:hypothetical protein
MEVILRPLRKNQWAGLYKYKNCSDYLGTYFTRSGAIYTGLTEEDAKRLGEKVGKSLHPSSEFWLNFYVRVPGKDVYLHLEDPWDELKYLFLKNHKRVANGLSDTKPTANYVLINKEVEATESNKINQIKRKAMKDFDKLSLSDMRKVLRLYGTKADNLTSDLVESKLFELVEKDPEKFFELWVNNTRRETEYIIQEAVSKNIIRRNKSEYKYGTDTIGHTLDDAITYLDSPENRDLKAIIINEVNSK